MTASLYSWGRYPDLPQTPTSCRWQDEVSRQLTKITQAQGSTLPFGNGRSYGDSCLAASGHVLTLRGLNRFIQTDWTNGRIIAEAGITLGEILAVTIPNGWFLPVTPGTQFVTLGGAIANDVHGKNHHVRGTFGNHVRRFELLRHEEAARICSPTQHSEFYQASIGGLGLTGVITWAEMDLIPIRSAQIDSTVLRFASLEEFFSLSSELDHKHEYSVAWIDCLATGKQTGRGVFMVGDHAEYGTYEVREPRTKAIPFTPPLSLINRLSLKAFNEAYWRRHSAQPRFRRTTLQPFFYPLDSVHNWNRIYGTKGFQQYQCVIPNEAAEGAIKELLGNISRSGQGSFLAVLKKCGDSTSPGLMSFPRAGVSLALDFPNNNQLPTLFTALDGIVRTAGGRLYPAKDAHMQGSDFRTAYPAWEQVEALRDPLLNSQFWKRVTT